MENPAFKKNLLVWFFGVTLLLAGCGGTEGAGDPPLPSGPQGKADTLWTGELDFVNDIQPGDIVLSSGSEENECWYLAKWQNTALRPRFCHAGMVVAKDEEGVRTIEALNEGSGIQILQGVQEWWTDEAKLAIVRVHHRDGTALSQEEIDKVIETALPWLDAPYVEPPISLNGDPLTDGLYCSMLPYRAYRDAVGIDLDRFSIHRSVIVPFIVTPDELYEAPDVEVVYEDLPDPDTEMGPDMEWGPGGA